MFRWALYFLW